jgi:hypothetical protein
MSLKFSVLVASFAIFAGAVSGCATPAPDEPELETSEAALGESATITFDGSFRQRITGTIEKGRKVRVAYDPGRLTTCRGEQAGRPAWAITGFWKIGDGPVRTFEAGGHSPSNGAAPPVLPLDASGELQIWFQNTNRWGCSAFDSAHGNNYRFAVAPAAHEPGWMGNVQYAIERQTCGGICDGALKPVTGPIVYGTWARQRAAVRAITFEVWKDGVTSWDNPDLWRQLDVQVHSRVGGTGPFTSRYVRFDKRLGNNARYAVDLSPLDPIPGLTTVQNPADCPAFPLESSGAYVAATLELYVTVNGAELRPEGGGTFRVRYENYAGLYAPCVP